MEDIKEKCNCLCHGGKYVNDCHYLNNNVCLYCGKKEDKQCNNEHCGNTEVKKTFTYLKDKGCDIDESIVIYGMIAFIKENGEEKLRKIIGDKMDEVGERAIDQAKEVISNNI